MDLEKIEKADLVLAEMLKERQSQDDKWGEQNHPCLMENFMDLNVPEVMNIAYQIPSEEEAKRMCDNAFKEGRGTYGHIALEEFCEVIGALDPVERRAELVQLGAVVCAWIEKIDRDEVSRNKG